MSPSEATREKAISLLADPVKGLNPSFISSCQSRNIEVPVAGDGSNTSLPFDFGANSSTLFRMLENIDWLGANSSQQYPCIVIGAKSARQYRQNRVKGAKFTGDVVVRMCMYLAWYTQETPPDNDFEKPLDALEEAAFNVLNADATAWAPVLYSNLLDIDRLPMSVTNNQQLVRRGLEVEITGTLIF